MSGAARQHWLRLRCGLLEKETNKGSLILSRRQAAVLSLKSVFKRAEEMHQRGLRSACANRRSAVVV